GYSVKAQSPAYPAPAPPRRISTPPRRASVPPATRRSMAPPHTTIVRGAARAADADLAVLRATPPAAHAAATAPERPTKVDPTLERLLEHMVTINASDLYLTSEVPPTYRVDGAGLAGKHPATP